MQKSIDCIKNNYEKMTETAHYLVVERSEMAKLVQCNTE